MIRVHRGDPPQSLLRSHVLEAKAQAVEFFEGSPAKRRQRRFQFDEGIWQSANQALSALFHNKCAYCDSRNKGPKAYHFRPIREVAVEDRKHADEGYWWLAYEWKN